MLGKHDLYYYPLTGMSRAVVESTSDVITTIK